MSTPPTIRIRPGRHYTEQPVTNRCIAPMPAILAAVALLVLLGGCSISSSQPDDIEEGVATLEQDADVADSGADREANDEIARAAQAYDECLAEEGFDLDSFDEAATGGIEDDPAAMAALETCAPLMSNSSPDLVLDPQTQADLVDSSAAFAECARSILGVDVPDDLFLLDPGDPRAAMLSDIDPTPEQEAELATCAESVTELGSAGG